LETIHENHQKFGSLRGEVSEKHPEKTVGHGSIKPPWILSETIG